MKAIVKNTVIDFSTVTHIEKGVEAIGQHIIQDTLCLYFFNGGNKKFYKNIICEFVTPSEAYAFMEPDIKTIERPLHNPLPPNKSKYHYNLCKKGDEIWLYENEKVEEKIKELQILRKKEIEDNNRKWEEFCDKVVETWAQTEKINLPKID